MLSTIKGCSRLLKDALDYEGMLSTIKGCFRLSRMLSTEYGKKNCDDEEDVSYNVESLFTSIPVKETIEFILDEIYVRKVIKPFCKKRLIFKRLLERLTGECIFSVNGRLMKQIDGCQMGGPLSGKFADIFMIKVERAVVIPRNPLLYRRYVDDTHNRRKKGIQDELFGALNSYHRNLRYTIEENPDHFLDTAYEHKNGETVTSVHVKPGKLPVFWSSKVPKRYKRNAINGELHRALRISSDFEEEKRRIKKKYLDVGFPSRFIDSVIRDFSLAPNPDMDDIIPNWLFDDKQVLTVRLPFCPKNEEISKTFIRRLEEFTQEKFTFKIIWNTRTIRSLFPLKDRVEHRCCVIYEGICTCGEKYTGETNRNTDVRWSEHDTPSADGSDPSKHLHTNPTHSFTWRVVTPAPRKLLRRKILESYFIAKYKPKINVQATPRQLFLFRNGIT